MELKTRFTIHFLEFEPPFSYKSRIKATKKDFFKALLLDLCFISKQLGTFVFIFYVSKSKYI